MSQDGPWRLGQQGDFSLLALGDDAFDSLQQGQVLGQELPVDGDHLYETDTAIPF